MPEHPEVDDEDLTSAMQTGVPLVILVSVLELSRFLIL